MVHVKFSGRRGWNKDGLFGCERLTVDDDHSRGRGSYFQSAVPHLVVHYLFLRTVLGRKQVAGTPLLQMRKRSSKSPSDLNLITNEAPQLHI